MNHYLVSTGCVCDYRCEGILIVHRVVLHARFMWPTAEDRMVLVRLADAVASAERVILYWIREGERKILLVFEAKTWTEKHYGRTGIRVSLCIYLFRQFH